MGRLARNIESLTAPTLADIEALAERAVATLPEALAGLIGTVVVRVDDFADDETLDDLDIEDPFELMGLYRGTALPRKSVADVPQGIDMIFLYRRPLLDYWTESGEALHDVVRHIVIHEIGHHFGLSDEDMERIENDEG